jgi:Flp pilus assembly protein TadD
VAANGLIAEAWSDLGFVRLAQGDVKQAQSYIQKALDLDPDYLQAKINLASVYLAKERWKDARAVMNDILKTDPHNKRINAALRYLDEQGL